MYPPSQSSPPDKARTTAPDSDGDQEQRNHPRGLICHPHASRKNAWFRRKVEICRKLVCYARSHADGKLARYVVKQINAHLSILPTWFDETWNEMSCMERRGWGGIVHTDARLRMGNRWVAPFWYWRRIVDIEVLLFTIYSTVYIWSLYGIYFIYGVLYLYAQPYAVEY